MHAAPTIDLYEAIKEMRRLTSVNQSFSFVHATYDRERDESNGFRSVKRAILRPAAKGDDQRDADHMLFYQDQEIGQPRKCWQILLMWFNGKKCILN
jgi:hypothetical protein